MVYPVVIEGEHVVLREWVDDDLAALVETLGDPDVVRHVPLDVLDEADASRLLERMIDEALADPRQSYALAVVPRGDDTPCGTIALTLESPRHRRCEIGFALARRVWGRGFAGEAVRLMVEFGFDHVGARRIWGVCTPDNAGSARVLARGGMEHEGTLRSDLLIDGVWRDSQMWAVVAPTVGRVTDARPLTERQAERRSRVIRAALELAAEGGYDGVQMRGVAHRADVALGTVYHYFTSKDHLLAESMVEFVGQLAAMVEQYPAVGSTNYERVHDLLRRTTTAMARNQLASAALIGGLVAEGPQVAACQDEMHRMFASIFSAAFDEDFPREDRDRIIRTLEHVWFSCLIAWKNGWMPLEQAIAELEASAEVLFSGRG